MQRIYAAFCAVARNTQEYVETCSGFAPTLSAILMCITYKTGLYENAVISQ